MSGRDKDGESRYGSSGMRADDEPTRPMNAEGDRQESGGNRSAEPQFVSVDDQTRIIGAQRSPNMTTGSDPMQDPVVGWLVVVSGVGKGTHRPIGYGQNVVGRGEDARIKLAYGTGLRLGEGATQHVVNIELAVSDGSLSRKHFLITYEERSRRFWIEKSQEAANPTYIKVDGNEEPLFNPRELNPYDRIIAGKTELMFVPLCGPGTDDSPGFDWKDT